MKRIILILGLFLCFHSIQAQNIEDFLEKVEEHHLQNPQEKIYLHLDKYAYTAGETIWFKAYTTIGIENLFSNWSNIGYVELIDPSQKVIKTEKIALVNGIGIGNLSLIDTLTEGSYRLRAYTQWMRNADPAYFYDHTLQISNGRSDDVITSSAVAPTNKGRRYTVKLQSLQGLPLSKTRVNYQLIRDGEVVDRGRESTDEQGLLHIDVNQKYADALIKLRFENQAKLPVNKVIKPISLSAQNSVTLLPEGGKLLHGVINNIAAKAINPQGLGVKAKVAIFSNSDTLAIIQTNALGMGSAFAFLGDSMGALSAKAFFEDGSETPVAVPEVHSSGYSLVVNTQMKNRILSQVNLSQEFENQEDIYFVAHHLGRIFFVSKQKANKKDLFFALQRELLPNGVITISILNSQLVPVVERAFFNYRAENRLPIALQMDKAQYGTREAVAADIRVGESSDSLRIAALSASVVNLSKIHEDYQTAPNILSSLLLSADIKGFIENPGYYFQNDTVNFQEIDQLMLTQAWRNIAWDKVGTASTPTFAPEKAIKISGYTKKLGRQSAEPNARVQLISTQNFMDYLDTVSNEDGYFEFEEVLFPDSVKFLISARTAKGKNNIDIIVNSIDPPGIGINPNAALEKNDINALFVDQIQQSKQHFAQMEAAGLMEKSILIEEVVVRASTKKKVSENSRNLNGPGNADQVITAEEMETCTTLEMCLTGRLMGVMWRNGVPYNTRGNVPMQVVLDGMFIEPDQIWSVNIQDIESVEVLRNANYTAIYGMNGGNGLIILTSKTGLSAMRNYVPRGILTIQPQGISLAKEFYKPQYEANTGLNLQQDLRTTIHWESGIVTDESGNASMKFYTSDEKGKYLIRIEGLDLRGRIGHKLLEVEVK